MKTTNIILGLTFAGIGTVIAALGILRHLEGIQLVLVIVIGGFGIVASAVCLARLLFTSGVKAVEKIPGTGELSDNH